MALDERIFFFFFFFTMTCWFGAWMRSEICSVLITPWREQLSVLDMCD